MDLSILAAVGSFVVSERLIKPKSLILAGLGILLCYDLATKTYDPAGRVYRGPGLIASILMTCAFSLRQWRRNNVACDELLFLPGTPYAKKHASSSTRQHFMRRAASQTELNGASANIGKEAHNLEMVPINATTVESSSSGTVPNTIEGGQFETLGNDDDSISMNSIIRDEENAEADDENDKSNPNKSTMMRGLLDDCHSYFDDDTPLDSCLDSTNSDNNNNNNMNSNSLCDKSSPAMATIIPPGEKDALSTTSQHSKTPSWDSDSDDGHWAYAPSGAAVFGASLDLLLPVFFNFHLFTLAINYASDAKVSPRLFPFFFFNVIIFRGFIPPGKRCRFWGTLKYTLTAPYHKVSFRDEVIGDVLTSSVRPIQDLAFALFYYGSCFRVAFTSRSMSDVISMIERNFTLHNFILPLCAILPLWFRFLQTLRIIYDTKRRFPHMANSFKYLSAALVVLYGIAHPENRRSNWWILAFAAATLYQILCDVFIDWELFTLVPSKESSQNNPSGCAISSMSQQTCFSCYRIIVQPIMNLGWFLQNYYCIPSGYTIGLRKTRLFRNEHFYWGIFWGNIVLRFCWMLSFIPAYRLSETGDIDPTFSSELNSYIGVFITLAEIGRRGLWAILRVEIESIKLTDPTYTTDDIIRPREQVSPRKGFLSYFYRTKTEPDVEYESLPTTTSAPKVDDSTRSSTNNTERLSSCQHILLLLELTLWACAFVGFGYMVFFC